MSNLTQEQLDKAVASLLTSLKVVKWLAAICLVLAFFFFLKVFQCH
jgi:hypothetical protein